MPDSEYFDNSFWDYFEHWFRLEIDLPIDDLDVDDSTIRLIFDIESAIKASLCANPDQLDYLGRPHGAAPRVSRSLHRLLGLDESEDVEDHLPDPNRTDRLICR